MMKKKYSLGFVLTLMLIASALTCLIFVSISRLQFSVYGNKNQVAGRNFTAMLERIEEMYIGEYEIADVYAAAMRATVDALEDRWSYYMTPEEYAEYQISVRNQYTGIGVSVVIDEEAGGMGVLYTYRGSPAEKSGILSGDVITGVDGESLAGLDLNEIRDLLARPIGETAELTVLRLDGTIETILVMYDMIFVDPISYEMLDGKIGYIEIANFEGGSADGFITAVDWLLAEGAVSLVFDVRGNGGGRVNEMTRMLDYLLPEGEIFISVDRNGREDIIWSDSEMVEIPAVVIVDRYSFSAAEYFAATLNEYGYAEIVGEQTTGKSRSQRTEQLPDGGALHISTSQYLTKNRVALYDVGGVTPDYQIRLSDEEFQLLLSGNLDKDADPQLKMAVSVLTHNS